MYVALYLDTLGKPQRPTLYSPLICDLRLTAVALIGTQATLHVVVSGGAKQRSEAAIMVTPQGG